MKIWLDDIRDPPGTGWIVFRTADGLIDFLYDNLGSVEEMSLDHDLGTCVAGTGMDVLEWLEAQQNEFPDLRLPEIHIHTMNPSAGDRMRACLQALLKRADARKVQVREQK